MYGDSVDQRIFLSQLNFLDDLAGFPVVPEERSPVRVGYPESVVLPTHSVRAITGQLPHCLNLPCLRLKHVQSTRRQNGDVQEPVTVLHALTTFARRPGSSGERNLSRRQRFTASPAGFSLC